jgi:hypothetical protein
MMPKACPCNTRGRFQESFTMPGHADPHFDDLLPPRRRCLLHGAAFLLGLAGGAPVLSVAAAGAAAPTVTISRAQIVAALASQFPQRRRMAELFDVDLGMPRLGLDLARNLILSEFDIAATETLFTRQTVRGVAGFACGLRYAAADHSVRLARVALERLDLAGVGEPAASQLQLIGHNVAQSLLENYPVHTLPPEHLRLLDAMALVPATFTVTPNGITVGFKPGLG